MDPELLNWLKENSGRTFESPRKDLFGSNPQDLTIRYVEEEDKLVRISFSEKKTLALPLYFWMFDRTLEHLKRNPEAAYPIGARLQPPYPKESVEEAIWREPMLYSSPYKSSPHVLDILALAGFVKFQKTRSRDTNKQVQGAKYSRGPPPPPKEQELPTPPLAPRNPKKEFLEKHRNSIIKWTETNKVNIVRSRLDYRWKKHTRYQCERSRNMVSKAITMSRIRNQGAVDLRTLDQVMEWGFNRKYPDRDPEKALKTTLEAFQYLDRGDI